MSQHFRHVEATKLEDETFLNVPTPFIDAHGSLLKANGKYVAYGGLIENKQHLVVKNLLLKDANDIIINGVKPRSFEDSPICSLEFSPYNDSLIVAGNENGTVYTICIPKDNNGENATLLGDSSQVHKSATKIIKFHPSCASIIATTGDDCNLNVLEISKLGSPYFNFNKFGQNHPFDMQWNYDGSQMALTTNDGFIRLFDPRTSKEKPMKTKTFENLYKAGKCFWMQSMNWIGATGFDSKSQREMKFWDIRKFKNPIYSNRVDKEPLILMPHWDNGNKILYTWSKKGVQFSWGSVTNDSKMYNPLGRSRIQNIKSPRGGDFLPKRDLDVANSQVEKFYMLTQKHIIPISFTIRSNNKDDTFLSEIYHDAPSGYESLSYLDYINGKSSDPKLMSLKPTNRSKYTKIDEMLYKYYDTAMEKTEYLSDDPTSMRGDWIKVVLQLLSKNEAFLEDFELLLDYLLEIYNNDSINQQDSKESKEDGNEEEEDDDPYSLWGDINVKKLFANFYQERRRVGEYKPIVIFMSREGRATISHLNTVLKDKYREIIDINATEKSTPYNALYYAVSEKHSYNRYNIAKCLIDNGINVNHKYTVHDGGFITILNVIGKHGGETLLKLLLPLPGEDTPPYFHDFLGDSKPKSKQIKFNYSEFINAYDSQQKSTFGWICDRQIENGFNRSNCIMLKHLLKYEKEYNILPGQGLNINITGSDLTALMLACNGKKNGDEFMTLLLDTFDFDANEQIKSTGETVLHHIMNISDGMEMEEFENRIKMINVLFNHGKTKDVLKASVMSYDKSTPMMEAMSSIARMMYQSDFYGAQKRKLFNSEVIPQLIALESNIDKISINSLTTFASYGDIFLFRQVMYNLFKIKCNVNSWDDLIDKHKLLTDEYIEEWISVAQKYGNQTIVGFLTNLKKRAFDTKSLNVLYLMLHDEEDDNDGGGAVVSRNQKNKTSTRLAHKSADYLYKNCQKETLEDLSGVINNAISKQECGFDDSLLFLAKLVNNDALVKTLEETTSNCLGNEKKNNKSYSYFKNNLLNSKIWGTSTKAESVVNTDVSTDVSEEKENEKEKELLLFEQIELNVIEKELEKQRELIKKSILKEKQEFSKNWNELVNTTYAELNGDAAKRFPMAWDKSVTQILELEYNRKELPFDNVNGFDGSYEYDHNGYLTKLLLTAHQIDPMFHQTLKKIFSENGISCSYTPAPPKTKARCQRKAELDYSNSNKYSWPNTKYIVDLVRGSVVFENCKDMVNGINLFINMFKDNKTVDCIKGIVRIKNGFNDFKELDNNDNDKIYTYKDVKFNVFISYTAQDFTTRRVIGEIQMLPRFMLEAKKLGHSVYSFVRNEDYYKEIAYYLSSRMNIGELNKIILSQNMSLLSKLLENCNEIDKKQFFINNQDKIIDLLQEGSWKKGKKLFELFIHSWNQSV